MIRLMIPLIMTFLGGAAGIGAALLYVAPMRPGDDKVAEPVSAQQKNYVRLNNQFIVPVMEGGRVGAMVVLALGIETNGVASDYVFTYEPKLRDEFLRILFDHANTGGFRGTFTDGSKLVPLRRALLEVARKTLGPTSVFDVLIIDIARQDM